MTPYYVYIILCDGNSFYTGYTRNLKSRIRMHMNGRGARYTKTHRPKELVYVEQFTSISQAMQRERKIKRLNHQQKHELTRKHVKKGKLYDSIHSVQPLTGTRGDMGSHKARQGQPRH